MGDAPAASTPYLITLLFLPPAPDPVLMTVAGHKTTCPPFLGMWRAPVHLFSVCGEGGGSEGSREGRSKIRGREGVEDRLVGEDKGY